jgi:hypothetical protein
MLLGFKRRFEGFVREGSKTHTIRGERKDGKAPRVGETCHCYVDPRQKSMKLLGRWECVRAERIRMYEAVGASYGVEVVIDGVVLDRPEKDALAHRDGFRKRGFQEMCKFWKGRLPFKGWVIHWKWTAQGVNAKKLKRAA